MQQSPRKFWEVWGRSDALYNRWAAAHGVNNYRLFVLYVLDNHPGATQEERFPHTRRAGLCPRAARAALCARGRRLCPHG